MYSFNKNTLFQVRFLNDLYNKLKKITNGCK